MISKRLSWDLARDSKGLDISQCLQAVTQILICSLSPVFAPKPGGPSPFLHSPHFFLVFSLFICCEIFCFSHSNKVTPMLIPLISFSSIYPAILFWGQIYSQFVFLTVEGIQDVSEAVSFICVCYRHLTHSLNGLTWSLACDIYHD